MLGIGKLYHMFVSNVVPSSLGSMISDNRSTSLVTPSTESESESRAKALITVFGMDKDGRIAKEKACNVVKQLGLVKEEEEESSFVEVLDEHLEAKQVLIELQEEEKQQLLRQAFEVFDEDGDGFIDAKEIKRVFMCLGLDNGWDTIHIHNMIKVVDLNLDGKVDFHEFQLMMA